ncbi:hypothetical protein B0I35DRAFT_509577 [Stachybotrys elegans]|uniref:Uncharacterized protein n=1 Tax=Stachybotrys elegans TaxID=80388 RepID=A0A8K0WU52_9HYPO|nr:hypothetical protein B0I35DRAFT_509577 [Stachybotrys elegans]
MDDNATEYPVYTGVWTNWSHGRILGATLTLDRSDGALLIAFVAFFIALVGTQAWRVVCFIMFHYYSSNSEEDGLYKQRQAILRNSTSPIGGFWILLQVMHAWSASRAAKPFRRLMPLLLLTLLIAAALTVASGFSSQIAQGNEVLVRSPNCGYLNKRTFGGNGAALEEYMAPYIARRIEQAADYAQRCYESSSSECNTFVRRALPVTATPNATCPFDDELCISQDSNLILDSGLMDSLEDLGLNTGPNNSNRFQLQYRLHCAPLATDKWKSTYRFEGLNYTRYQYGQGLDPGCNCTLAIDTDRLSLADRLAEIPFSTVSPGYELSTTYAVFSKGSVMEEFSSFQPVPGLSRHAGDLTLIFLSAQSMQYTAKSQDNWYRATTPGKRHITVAGPESYGETSEIFKPDEPAWPMGCVEQAQVCAGGACTGLGPWQDVIAAIKDLNISSNFYGDSYYLVFVEFLTNVLDGLRGKSLSSRFSAWNNLQSPPAANTWHLDVTHWFATILANLQIQLAEVPSGPNIHDPALEEWITRPDASERDGFCNSQKIHSTEYLSFSVLGIVIILLCGVLICAISVLIEPATTFFNRRLRPKASRYAELEWRANHVLHLQRLGHEDEAEWVQGPWRIPITKSAAKLSGLDDEDVEALPRLFRPSRDPGLGTVYETHDMSRKQTTSDGARSNLDTSQAHDDPELEQKRNSLVIVREIKHENSM